MIPESVSRIRMPSCQMVTKKIQDQRHESFHRPLRVIIRNTGSCLSCLGKLGFLYVSTVDE